MTNEISNSSNSSPNPETGATDSPWKPSWWHWLISALSRTVETEKQTANLRKGNEDLRKQNERLAELESKIDKYLLESLGIFIIWIDV